ADSIEPKVVGGTSITISEAPYQVSVRLSDREKRSYGSGHICGGVVISQRLVASAAHCIYNSNTDKYRGAGEFMLVMGSTYLTSRDVNTLEFYVQQVIVHPEFNYGSLNNDIAVLFINGYIPWSAAYVKALPINTKELATATRCVVTGWGVTKNGDIYASNTLQSGVVPVVSYTDCAVGYGTLPRTKLCAGYMTGGIDSCQGDSGGPLMCNNALSGIVSYGSECAKAMYPGVYANASYFNKWLVETNNSLDYSVYKNGAPSLGATIYAMWLAILGTWMTGQ
ncbi:hypothetical protein KR222_006146, partial [Zaprionus bogoriensis]